MKTPASASKRPVQPSETKKSVASDDSHLPPDALAAQYVQDAFVAAKSFDFTPCVAKLSRSRLSGSRKAESSHRVFRWEWHNELYVCHWRLRKLAEENGFDIPEERLLST